MINMPVTRPAHFTYRHTATKPVSNGQTMDRPTRSARGKKRLIYEELRRLGVTWYGFTKPEIRELPLVLQDREHVKGVVYGRHEDGNVALVVTGQRILFIDYKPFFKNIDELPFNIVGGISFGRAGLFSTVTLHTVGNDYKIRTMNWASSKHFIDFIESRCLEV